MIDVRIYKLKQSNFRLPFMSVSVLLFLGILAYIFCLSCCYLGDNSETLEISLGVCGLFYYSSNRFYYLKLTVIIMTIIVMSTITTTTYTNSTFKSQRNQETVSIRKSIETLSVMLSLGKYYIGR